MVIDRFILNNNQIMLFPCFTFIPKTGIGLTKTENIFFTEEILPPISKSDKTDEFQKALFLFPKIYGSFTV